MIRLKRRRLLASGALAAALPSRVFAQTAASARPQLLQGVQSGDFAADGATVWSRSDRPARMFVDYATTESFSDSKRLAGPLAVEATDFTSRLRLRGLPPGQTVFYRVSYLDLSDYKTMSEPLTGRFRTPPDSAGDVSFVWSADTVGQGWGINPDFGGLRIYETLRRAKPDFFIHCGDTIYADSTLASEVKLPDGTTWNNIVTPAKSKVAETLDEFRGNHLYNLLDENVRRFNAEVPQITVWDDHEVRNNWYPQQILDDERYTEKSVAVLSRRARQAFLEHVPIRIGPGETPHIYRSYPYGPLLDIFALDLRTYRGPNSPNRQSSRSAATALAGAAQIDWLKHALAASTAAWKVVASDLPLGVIVPDGDNNFEAFANGDGPPLGRELEVADLLGFIKQRAIKNVIWVTADVHYAAAHRYDPERARFKDFRPFWEFVAGPLHAATGSVDAMDDTFGPEIKFLGVPRDLKSYPGPAAGMQFFGTVRIAAATHTMTVRLHNLKGDTIYTVDLPPERSD